MKQDKYLVGIDFGTSNSCAGVFINGKVKIIPNKLGETITPSVVLFKIDKENPLVGEEAICESILYNPNYITEVKRFIGLTFEEFLEFEFDKKKNYKIINDNNIPKIELYYNGKKQYKTAEEISSFIIKKMMQSTEDFLAQFNEGISIDEAIFTVPAQFSDHQKNGLINAAKRAGIKVPRIVNEPTAAALAYAFNHKLNSKNKDTENIYNSINDSKINQETKLMVFDLGGGTFDISLLRLNVNNKSYDFKVQLTEGNINIGGSDFDEILKQKCIKEFCQKYNINEDDLLKDYNALRRLKAKCESTKKMLSTKTEANILLENFFNNKNLEITIKQEEFLNLSKPLVSKIENKITNVLTEMKLTKNDINYVILIGGGSKICGIKPSLIKLFGEEKIKDDINPEEAVAIGATYYAAKTQGKQPINFNLQDIIPYNIGIAVKNQKPEERQFGDLMHTIIPKYSKFPGNKYVKRYRVNLSDKHPSIVVNVFEGNNKFVRQNTKIGYFLIDDLKERGIFEYALELEVDLNGKLIGSLKCEQLGKETDYKSKIDIHHGMVGGKLIKISRNNNIKPLASVIADINMRKEKIENTQDINIRLRYLEECSLNYEELIKKYSSFIKYNENLIEKLFYYTKDLFNFYLDIIYLKENKKDEISEILVQIKEKMKNLIKEPDYVEDLLKIFLVLRDKYKDIFYQIFVNYIELLNDKGMELLNAKFGRYYLKLYFEKVFFNDRKYVIEKDKQLIDIAIREKYDKQMNINKEGLEKMNSYAFYIYNCIKNEQFIAGKTGFTLIDKKIKKLGENPSKEEILEILDIFHNMLNSFPKTEESIEVAFCLAHIILINYINLQIKDYDKLERYIVRFKIIMSSKNLKKIPKYDETIAIINELDN